MYEKIFKLLILRSMQKNKKILTLIIAIIGFVCGSYYFNIRRGSKELLPTNLSKTSFNIALVYPEIKDFNEQTKSAELGIEAAIAQLSSSNGILNKKPKLTLINTEELNLLKSNSNTLSMPDIFIVLGGDTFIKNAIEIIHPLEKPLFYLGFGRCKTLLNKTDTQAASLVYGLGLTWESSVEPLFLNLIEKAYPQGNAEENPTFSASYFTADMEDERRLTTELKTTAENLEVLTASEEYSDIRIADYYPSIQKIISSKSSFLLISNPYIAGQMFLQQAFKQSLTRDRVVAGLGTFGQEFIANLPKEANGAVTIDSYYPEIKTEENENFKKLLKKLAPNRAPSELAASAYGAVLLASATYEKMNSLDNKQFNQEIKNVEINFPNGKVSINPENNILSQEHYILRVEDGALKLVESLATASHPKLSGCY